MGKTNVLNSHRYTNHDHLSNGGERTQIAGTQNTGAKSVFCINVSSSTLPRELTQQPLLSLALGLMQHQTFSFLQ